MTKLKYIVLLFSNVFTRKLGKCSRTKWLIKICNLNHAFISIFVVNRGSDRQTDGRLCRDISSRQNIFFPLWHLFLFPSRILVHAVISLPVFSISIEPLNKLRFPRCQIESPTPFFLTSTDERTNAENPQQHQPHQRWRNSTSSGNSGRGSGWTFVKRSSAFSPVPPSGISVSGISFSSNSVSEQWVKTVLNRQKPLSHELGSEWASEQKAQRTAQAKPANKWAVWANVRAEERTAWYSKRLFLNHFTHCVPASPFPASLGLKELHFFKRKMLRTIRRRPRPLALFLLNWVTDR